MLAGQVNPTSIGRVRRRYRAAQRELTSGPAFVDPGQVEARGVNSERAPLWLRSIGGIVLGILGVSAVYAVWIALENLGRIGV